MVCTCSATLRTTRGITITTSTRPRKRKLWFIAQTHYQCELLARRELLQQGYEVEYPQYQLPRNRDGVRVVRPLFEGYVFIRACDAWRSVNGTRGVQRLLLNGETPSAVDDSDLQWFRDCTDEKGYYVDPSVRVLKAGDTVSPRTGRFAGIYGEFLRMTSRSRCEVLFWMLGKGLTSTHAVDDLG